MIKVDQFSGRVYVETENFKQSDNGDTFLRCGDTWFGSKGQTIQKRDDELFNLRTGISSRFGDPFKDE